MPSAAWIAIIVTLTIFVVTHIVITVWWASRVDTLLSVVQSNLEKLVMELKSFHVMFVTREEAARELAIAEKEQKAMWKKIDELHEISKGGLL